MKLHKLSHLLLFFILLFPASPIIITGCSSSLFVRKPGTLSESELKNVLKEITVKVIVDDKEAASGTIIKKQNGFYTVLTNYHVIENAKSVKIVTPDNQVYPVEFSKVDRQDNKKDDLYDLAKLTFSSEKDKKYLVASLGEENIKPGEKVFAGGYVKGNLQTTKGTAKLFLNQPLIKGQQIAYDNDIQQGMSGGAIINEKGYLVGINSKLAHPVLQTDFRYLQGEQPDEKTLKEWSNYSWGIAVNLVDEAAPDLSLFPERVIRKVGGIPAKVLDIAKQSSVQIKKADGGIGSGVIIAKDNDVYYVLTAGHVVEDKQEYQVVAPDKQVYKVDNQTIRTRKGLDMAVLQFRSSQVYQVATLANDKLSDKLPMVYLYGWKGEETNYPSFFSMGIIKNKDDSELWAKTKGYELAYTNEGCPGMSGGGIWDIAGKLVGIHNASVTDILGYSLGLSTKTFLFYNTDNLWQLPQNKLKILENDASTNFVVSAENVESFLLAALPTFANYSQPDTIKASYSDWLRDGYQIWRMAETWKPLKLKGVDNNRDPGIILMQRAINSMNKAIDKKPDLWIAYYSIAFMLFSEKQYDQALFYIDRSIQIQKAQKQSIFYYSYFIKSDILQNKKNYIDAINNINAGIKEREQQPNQDIFLLYKLRGDIFHKLGIYNEAIADYTKVTELNPQYIPAYLGRAATYHLNNMKDLAITDYNQVIAIDPHDGTAYVGRGFAYHEQGKIDLAVADYTKAISINTETPVVYYNRGRAYFQQQKLDQALSDYNQSLSLEPEFLEGTVYSHRAAVYMLQGKLDLAVADFNKVISINSKDKIAYFGRGIIYLDTGNKQQGIKDLETAAKLYQQQGDIQKAKQIQELLNHQ